MSRLIDAEVAEKMLRVYADEVGCHRGEYELANGILKAVCYLENVPTAYDVDKVVEQLEELKENYRKVRKSTYCRSTETDDCDSCRADHYLDARLSTIDRVLYIVKSGVI